MSDAAAPGGVDLVAAIAAAERRIRPFVRETPIEPSPVLGGDHCRVHLKLENLQRTGSFKLRGATNAVQLLTPAQRQAGVVAASSGNHGLGVACASRDAGGCKADVFVPTTAPAHKVDAITALGAEVHRHGDDCVETELHARAWAAERGAHYLSPYNDLTVIAGQGTIGVEVTRRLRHADAVVLAVGGGGLLAGVASWLGQHWPGVQVIAASPAASPALHDALAAGRLVPSANAPTLSDATAGGLEPGAITLELCKDRIHRFHTVGEGEIAHAMRLVLEHHHMLIEGAAAVAVAGFLREREALAGKDVLVVLCGANVGLPTLRSVLAADEP